jgi:hypothetical protein
LALMQQGDAWQLQRVPVYEKVFNADSGEPSEVYKAAKARAEGLMRERGTGDPDPQRAAA